MRLQLLLRPERDVALQLAGLVRAEEVCLVEVLLQVVVVLVERVAVAVGAEVARVVEAREVIRERVLVEEVRLAELGGEARGGLHRTTDAAKSPWTTRWRGRRTRGACECG